MAIAAGVLVVEVVGTPKRELIDSVLLALLGVTAFALLRDRGHRIDLDEVRQLASDAMTDRPYEVISQTNEWDIKDRTNSTITVTQQLRIIRNEVSTIEHWSRGEGRVERYDAKWRRLGGQWVAAHKIHQFRASAGAQRVIYSFDDEHCRGDMLDWRLERDAVDRFPTAHEGVELTAKTQSDHPRVMRVIWPPNDAPSHIELRWEGQPARTLTAKRKNGRSYVEEKIVGVAVGQAVGIAWIW